MSTGTHPWEKEHPGPATYIRVAVVLTVITFLELWVFFAPALQPFLVPILVVLSAIKFALVAMFYMHLKFESWLFSGVFLAGLALAFAVGIGLLGLFVALGGEPREFAETNRVAFAHPEEAQVSEPATPAGTTEETGQPAQTGTQETAPAAAAR